MKWDILKFISIHQLIHKEILKNCDYIRGRGLEVDYYYCLSGTKTKVNQLIQF